MLEAMLAGGASMTMPIVATGQTSLVVHDTESGADISPASQASLGKLCYVGFSSNGEWLAAGWDSGYLYIYQIVDRQCVLFNSFRPAQLPIVNVVFSPNCSYFCVVYSDGTDNYSNAAVLYSLADGSKIYTWPGYDNRGCAAFSLDEQYLYVTRGQNGLNTLGKVRISDQYVGNIYTDPAYSDSRIEALFCHPVTGNIIFKSNYSGDRNYKVFEHNTSFSPTIRTTAVSLPAIRNMDPGGFVGFPIDGDYCLYSAYGLHSFLSWDGSVGSDPVVPPIISGNAALAALHNPGDYSVTLLGSEGYTLYSPGGYLLVYVDGRNQGPHPLFQYASLPAATVDAGRYSTSYRAAAIRPEV
ncbi:hypothetical protein MHM84_01250 [Halomonas sp. McH1-25]|uniref:hypothetical protein n=1 Tax=unclassified Halomonas TaxID=2609666 RepID=UPI001EF42B1E|nr:MULTISPECIES: hypothetical protein [unclassified Halomonas]MCG7598408.1 hypothetical protein [Halomonas sp. McH1-25]MCP1342650.1 hypothetical protein [Halomonas sp. FL8]MCP1361723.1 hypothetical protein [Halomonas sp. BBD45]MCP1363819.1 hypothetical protein [Halomonas sp. BBD48]